MSIKPKQDKQTNRKRTALEHIKILLLRVKSNPSKEMCSIQKRKTRQIPKSLSEIKMPWKKTPLKYQRTTVRVKLKCYIQQKYLSKLKME